VRSCAVSGRTTEVTRKRRTVSTAEEDDVDGAGAAQPMTRRATVSAAATAARARTAAAMPVRRA
jgi:hypothetical protein